MKPDSTPQQARRDANKLRQQIGARVPEIVETLTAAALNGDVQAARLLLGRALPALKPEAQATHLPSLARGDLRQRAEAALNAAAAGKLAPDVASTIVAAVGQLAKVAEIAELEERIAALEGAHE